MSRINGLWWLQLILYFLFGATLGFNGFTFADKPVELIFLFGLWFSNDIVSDIRATIREQRK